MSENYDFSYFTVIEVVNLEMKIIFIFQFLHYVLHVLRRLILTVRPEPNVSLSSGLFLFVFTLIISSFEGKKS